LGLTEWRLTLVKNHLKDGFDDDSRYLSGSLYLSAAVIGHLIQKESFPSLHVLHQSGSFDQVDPLFTSLPMRRREQVDFHELIIEFFPMPNFLINPNDFIDVNRQTLKPKFATSRLHHWIDLSSVGSRASHFLMKRTTSSSRTFTTPR
jgi:hypothetical protein